jgi:hypothetical protein
VGSDETGRDIEVENGTDKAMTGALRSDRNDAAHIIDTERRTHA